MRECLGCGNPVLDQYEEHLLHQLVGSTAIGRRILSGYCWVCTRLKATVDREIKTEAVGTD